MSDEGYDALQAGTEAVVAVGCMAAVVVHLAGVESSWWAQLLWPFNTLLMTWTASMNRRRRAP